VNTRDAEKRGKTESFYTEKKKKKKKGEVLIPSPGGERHLRGLGGGKKNSQKLEKKEKRTYLQKRKKKWGDNRPRLEGVAFPLRPKKNQGFPPL